jgi:DNA mismatch repair protein MutH
MDTADLQQVTMKTAPRSGASEAALPPSSEAELLQRANALAGETLGAVAARFGLAVPAEMRRAKGFAGSLLERALGASAGSRARPDFEALGIELKTLPVNAAGEPLETTFVCTISPLEMAEAEWATSRVREKLLRVLWLPLRSERSLPLASRMIGSPILWSPSPEEEAQLRWDWEELSGLLGRGAQDDVHGRLGQVLQVRPKAANSRSRRAAFDSDGTRVDTLPRGFYLRTAFTRRIVQQHLRLSATEE